MESFGVLYIWKEPVLTKGQFDRLSNIFDNAGNVFLAILVVSPLVTGIDTVNGFAIVMGVLMTAGFWFISIFLARKGDI